MPPFFQRRRLALVALNVRRDELLAIITRSRPDVRSFGLLAVHSLEGCNDAVAVEAPVTDALPPDHRHCRLRPLQEQ